MQAAPPSPATQAPDPTPWLNARLPLLGKRRRFLIHHSSQLRMALMVTGAASVVVTLLNIALHVGRSQAMAHMTRESPQLAPILAAQNRFEFTLGLAASAIFLAGLFVVIILETHKTAGAAYRLAIELERVRDGQYGSQLALRRGDNLLDLERAFNEMSRALAERGATDVQELDHIASVASRIEKPPEAGELAHELRELADDRRKLLVTDADD